jgi:2-C-methyl-D-erythritol 2,4-cyclodiphosphate synthase
VPESGVGLGFDVHPFRAGGELWLGGLLFDGEDGLSGHSDGDVVCHAVADAMLGAAAAGDVGEHFPEADAGTADLSGEELLGRTIRILSELGRVPLSIDVTIVCERPQIAPRRREMRDRLAGISGIPADRVSVKATRPEGLGLAGDGIGCLALATVT